MVRNVEKVFVLNTSGISFVVFDFSSSEKHVDDTLLTGFLSAIQSFASEVFKMQSDQFIIDNGTYRISLFKIRQLTVAIISEEDYFAFKDQFIKFLLYLMEQYPSFDSGIELSPELPIYENLRKKLVHILFREPIAEDWVPIPNRQVPEYGRLAQKYSILEVLDGQKDIQHLQGYSEATREGVYETINYAFFEHAIKFKNILESKDYVVATKNIHELLPLHSHSRQQFQDVFPSIDIMHLVLDLEQVCRIDSLQRDQGANIIPALEWMFNANLIQIIDEVPRKMLIAIDITDNLLEILHKLVGKQKIESSVRKIIFKLGTPEISARIQFDETRITAKTDKFILLTEKPEEIEQFAQQWIKFAQEIVADFYPALKEKFISQFYNLLTEQYLQVIHNRDLDLLTPILTKLEEFQVK